MMVMPANNSGAVVQYWAGRYPGYIGLLYSPGAIRGPFPWMPFALDNGAFTGFDGPKFIDHLEAIKKRNATPLWVVVPDHVGSKSDTLAMWDEWAPRVASFGWPLAFAVQDGMTPNDVPAMAEVVFVGGTTKFKDGTLDVWPKHFERCHLGRVNYYRRLWAGAKAGYESCDGTGWLRKGMWGPRNKDRQILEEFLERMAYGSGEPPAWQLELPSEAA